MSFKQGISIKQAMLIQLVSKYANVVVQLMITAILARLLAPEEFGVLAIVTVFTSFFALLADMGIGPSIVQFKSLASRDFDALFSFSIILGIVLSVAFCALSPLVAMLYGDSELIPLCCFSSLSILFNTLNMVPNGILLRNKKFVAIGVRLIVTTVLSGSITVVLAIAGLGSYALVSNSVLLSALVFMWNFRLSSIKLGNWSFRAPLKMVFSFASYQVGFSVINYFSRNLDSLFVGKAFGISSLGYYDKAYKLTSYPLSYLAGVISSVLQPYLAEYQDNLGTIYDYWVKISKALSLIAVLITAVFFCSSKEIVLLFYGNQWEAAIPLFQVLSLSVYFQIVNNPAGAILQSSNHTDYLFKTGLANTVITLVFLIIGMMSGSLFTAALMIALSYCLHTLPILYFAVHKVFQKETADYVKRFVPEVLTGLVAISLSTILGSFLSDNLIVSLGIKTATTVAIVLLGYAITDQLSFIKMLFGRGRGGVSA